MPVRHVLLSQKKEADKNIDHESQHVLTTVGMCCSCLQHDANQTVDAAQLLLTRYVTLPDMPWPDGHLAHTNIGGGHPRSHVPSVTTICLTLFCQTFLLTQPAYTPNATLRFQTRPTQTWQHEQCTFMHWHSSSSGRRCMLLSAQGMHHDQGMVTGYVAHGAACKQHSVTTLVRVPPHCGRSISTSRNSFCQDAAHYSATVS